MKLNNLKSLLESPTVDQKTGALTRGYGIIVEGGISSLDNTDVDCINVYLDETKFKIQIVKLFAYFTENDDDLLLTYDELQDHDEWGNFCESCAIGDFF